MTPLIHSPLDACLTLLALWGLIGLAGLLRPTSLRYVGRTLFPLGALCGAALAFVAITTGRDLAETGGHYLLPQQLPVAMGPALALRAPRDDMGLRCAGAALPYATAPDARSVPIVASSYPA